MSRENKDKCSRINLQITKFKDKLLNSNVKGKKIKDKTKAAMV